MENKTYGIENMDQRNDISKDEDYLIIVVDVLMKTFVSLLSDNIHLFSQMEQFQSMTMGINYLM